MALFQPYSIRILSYFFQIPAANLPAAHQSQVEKLRAKAAAREEKLEQARASLGTAGQRWLWGWL